MKITVVVPCYNEQDALPELFDRLEAALAEMKCDYEYIFVDDGSTDRTIAVLRSLRERSPKVGIISFRRNYGKSAALNEGFRAASLRIDPERGPDAELPGECLHRGRLVAKPDPDHLDPPVPELLGQGCPGGSLPPAVGSPRW